MFGEQLMEVRWEVVEVGIDRHDDDASLCIGDHEVVLIEIITVVAIN